MAEDSKTAALAITIPEKMLADYIRAEMVKAIPHPEKFVEAIVAKALAEKDERSYSNQTKFESAIALMIREETQAAFKAWLSEKRIEIRDALQKALNRQHKKYLAAVAEKLATGAAGVYVHSINLKIEGDDQ